MSIPDLDANFYSGPILKHVANIRQSVLVPHSMSSSSIHHSLENEKTSYMKNSPSMKALESMLANKKKPKNGEEINEAIVEEPSELNEQNQPNEPNESNKMNELNEQNEPHDVRVHKPKLDKIQEKAPLVSHSTPSLHGGESSSVQSFQTATSVDMSPSKNTSKSARTDGTGSSTYDETPELIQPAQFHTIKQTTKDFSPSIRVISAFQERRESAYSDHDETLIEAEQKEAPSLSQPASRLMIPDDILDSESKSKTILATMAAKPTEPKKLTEPKPSEQKPELEAMHPADANPRKLTASATLPQLAQNPPQDFPTHTRSNSSFSLSFNKNKDQPPIPGRQRRSSTFSDLTSKFINSKPEEEKTKAKPKPTTSRPEPTKKKFSFRALFKKKEPATIPTSASSPALAKPNPGSQSSGKNMFKKSKSTDTLSHLDEQNVAREQLRRRNTEETKTNVSAPAAPVKKLTDISNIKQPQNINQLQLSEMNKPQFFNPPPKQGLIREVSDYDLNDTYANSEPEDEYDRHNLSSDPATPYNPGRFDQEMKLDAGFGSPFQVEYKSPQQVEDEAKKEHQLNEVNDSKESTEPVEANDLDPNDPSDQLLGEALFPKSLSAQEVQSIVSLERSRSIRSVRSKHNSFANYNGSDDNIIQYTGAISVPNSGMTRSESILKRAKEQHLSTPSPKKAKSPSLTPEGTSDLNNFIEFSDYIDFDKLDFQLSPSRNSSYQPSPTPPAAETPVRQASPQASPRQVSHQASLQASPIIISSSASVESLAEIPKPVSVVVTPAEPEPEPEPKQLKPAAIVVSDHVEEEYNGPLTPNLETIDSFKLPSPTALPEEVAVVPRTNDKPSGARPISMSFRGLRGPNFGEKLTMHEVRSSESHQLFNISFGDDSNESGVGDGFGGSSDELELELELELENDKENIPLVLAVPPKPLFIHKKISLWGTTDSQSSPSSMNSFITRTFKRSPKVNNAVPQSPAGVRFSSRIILYDTYNGDDYDRHPDTATCNQLTPALAQMIKEELNQVKSEMEVHEDLRCYTHFF